MFKRAQSMMEITVLVCVVVIISLTVWSIYNGNSLKLVNMSKINTQQESSVNLKNPQTFQASEKVPYKAIETAGANALTRISMSEAQYKDALSDVTYGQLAAAFSAGGSDKSLLDLTNSLIEELNLSCPKISEEKVNSTTLETFTIVLNAVCAKDFAGDKSTADEFVEKFVELL